MFRAFIITTVIFLSGCATTGSDFPSDLNWIKENQTTKQDVRMLLGEPYSVGNSSGTATWTYGFYKWRLVGTRHTKELKFYWNGNGTVSRYSFNSSFPSDKKKQMMPRNH